MTITHHPSEDLLFDFFAGSLDEADRLVVAVHVAQCPSCRGILGAIELVGGVALEESAPVALDPGSFETVMARNGEDSPEISEANGPVSPFGEDGLPDVLRGRHYGKRRSVAPGVKLQLVKMHGASGSRAFLLWSAPGTRMLVHTHTGRELTCVLKGSFAHDGGWFGPGDFDYGDGSVNHQPVVGGNQPCLCIVAMSGRLKLHGWVGRLISPFVRI